MIINHNISALNAHRQLGANQNSVQGSLEKLSSGLRINKAGDDAAGLAISEKMRGQIQGLEMAQKNAQDGISLIQTAEGALNETHAILQRMRELAVQSGNDTNTDADRAEMQKEVDQLAQELSRISNTTEFNTQNLAGGNFEGKFHIGANSDQNITVEINAMDAHTLGVARDVTETTGHGSGSISGVELGKTVGGAIVNEAEITVTATGTPANHASVILKGTDDDTLMLNAKAGGNYAGAAGNDLQVVIQSSAGAEAGASMTNNVLTITLNSTNDMDVDAINAALTAGGFSADFEAAGGTGSVPDLTGDETATLAGGADAKSTLTLTDGTLTDNTIEIALDAKEVTIDSGAFAGLTFNVTGLADDDSGAAVGKILINSTEHKASAATFNADGTINENAVAQGGVNISNQKAADEAITTINNAIETVSAERSKLGAIQNRLDHTINNLGTSAENLTAAESRIRDVDMAKEMMEFTKNNILSQAAQSMLAQSQQMPQGVLQLLQ